MGILKEVVGTFLAAGLLASTANQSFAEGAGDYLAGSAALNDGNFEQAYENFSALAESDPTIFTYGKAVEAALGAGKIEEAIQYATNLGPISSIGQLALVVEAFQKSEKDLIADRISSLSKQHDRVSRYTADQLSSAQNSAQASEKLLYIAEAIKVQLGDENLAMVYAQAAIALVPEQAKTLAFIAELEAARENFESTIEYLDQALATNPEYTLDLQLMKAGAYTSLEKYDEAHEIYKMLYEDVDFTQWISVAEQQAMTYRFQGENEASIKIYTNILDRTGGIAGIENYISSVYYNRAVQYDTTGQGQKAEQDLRKAVGLNPHNADALNQLSYILIEQGKDLDEAIEMIKTAYDMTNGRNAYIVDSYGWALYKLGRYEEAVKEMQKATSLTPYDPLIVFHYGETLAAAGRTREASWEWQRAITLAEQYYPGKEYYAETVELAKQRLAQPEQTLEFSP